MTEIKIAVESCVIVKTLSKQQQQSFLTLQTRLLATLGKQFFSVAFRVSC